MEQLKFSNPIFKEGLNVTVRLGEKWATAYLSQVSLRPLRVDLALPDNTPINKKGFIEAVRVTKFIDIPQTALDLEHDPACHTLDGLYKVMKKVYPDTFTANSSITIVYFTVG